MPKKFSKKVEVRGGIRKFKFGAINGEKMEAMPKFSGRDMLVKKVNGEVSTFHDSAAFIYSGVLSGPFTGLVDKYSEKPEKLIVF